MTAGFLLFGHAAFPMQKQFIKKSTCPPLFLVSCQSVTADWFPASAVNREGLCSVGFFLTGSWLLCTRRGSKLVPTMELIWHSRVSVKLWSSQRMICAAVFAFAAALRMRKCMFMSLAADCGESCLDASWKAARYAEVTAEAQVFQSFWMCGYFFVFNFQGILLWFAYLIYPICHFSTGHANEAARQTGRSCSEHRWAPQQAGVRQDTDEGAFSIPNVMWMLSAWGFVL